MVNQPELLIKFRISHIGARIVVFASVGNILRRRNRSSGNCIAAITASQNTKERNPLRPFILHRFVCEV